jgi:hypothetical protein
LGRGKATSISLGQAASVTRRSNKRMHATADTLAIIFGEVAGRPVMRSVMRRSRARHELNEWAGWQGRPRAAFGFQRQLDVA